MYLQFCNFQNWNVTGTSFFMEDKVFVVLQIRYHGCWWTGVTKSQGISSHDMDLVLPEYSGLSRVKNFQR